MRNMLAGTGREEISRGLAEGLEYTEIDRSTAPRGCRRPSRELLEGGWSWPRPPASCRLTTATTRLHGCQHEATYQWVYAQPMSTLARELI